MQDWRQGFVGIKQAIAQVLKVHKRLRLWGMSKGIRICYHSLSKTEYHLSSAASKHPQGWLESALSHAGLTNNSNHPARFLTNLLVLSATPLEQRAEVCPMYPGSPVLWMTWVSVFMMFHVNFSVCSPKKSHLLTCLQLESQLLCYPYNHENAQKIK